MPFLNPKTAFDAQRRNPSARPLHFLFVANAEGKNRLLVSTSAIEEKDAETEMKKKAGDFQLDARKLTRGKAIFSDAGIMHLKVKKVPHDFDSSFRKCLKEHRIDCKEVTLGIDDESAAPVAEGVVLKPLAGKTKGDKYENEQYQEDAQGEVKHGGQFRGNSKTRTRYFDQEQVEASKLYKDAEGKLLDAQGRPVDTSGTEIGYVANAETGSLHQFDPRHAGPAPKQGYKVKDHHTSPLQGQDAAGAGTMEVEGGVVRKVTSQSGHYTPDGKLVHQFVDRLDQSGVQRRETELVDSEGKRVYGSARAEYPQVMQYLKEVEAGRRERDPAMEEKLRELREKGIGPSNRDAKVEYFDPDRYITEEEFEKVKGDENAFRNLMEAKFGSRNPGDTDPWGFAKDYPTLQTWMSRMAPQASLGAEQFLQTGGNTDAINRKRDVMDEIGRKVPKVLAEDTADVEAAALFEQLGGMAKLRTLAASKGVPTDSLESASPRKKLRALRQLLGLPAEDLAAEGSGSSRKPASATLSQIEDDNRQLANDFESLGGMARLDELAKKRGVDPSRYARMDNAAKATLLIRLLEQAGEPLPQVPSVTNRRTDPPAPPEVAPEQPEPLEDATQPQGALPTEPGPVAYSYAGEATPPADSSNANNYFTGGGNYMNQASPEGAASDTPSDQGAAATSSPDPRESLDLRRVRKEAAKPEQQLEQRYYRMGGDEALVEQLTQQWQNEIAALRKQLQSKGMTSQQINDEVRKSNLALPANLPRARVARMDLREKYNTLQVRRRP